MVETKNNENATIVDIVTNPTETRIPLGWDLNVQADGSWHLNGFDLRVGHNIFYNGTGF